MAYDERLVERIRENLHGVAKVGERRMFGGVCFTLNGNMVCGVQKTDLVVRVGPEFHEKALSYKHTRPMDFTGRPMKGYVYVSEPGYKSAAALRKWIDRGFDFVSSLPAKKAKPKAKTGNKRSVKNVRKT